MTKHLLILAVILLITLSFPYARTGAETVPSSTTTDPPRAPLDGWNLIVIVIDSLRADHLGCSGYGRATSPFIDSLAAGGVRFERAYANSSFTRESVSVLMTGRLPSSSGSAGWGAAPTKESETLAARFQKAGYRTGFFSNQVMLTDRFTRGFDEAHHLAPGPRVSRGGPKLSLEALEFIKSCKGKPYMLYLHYLDPHGPYHPPDEFYLHHAPKVFPKPLALYDEIRLGCEQLKKDGFGAGDPRFEDFVLRYDAEINFVDFAVSLLFKHLDESGRSDRTLVVITSDHGEEFLEHGYVEHAWTLYEESIRVPLIVWAPGVLKPAFVSRPVSLVDILPTVLELTGLPVEEGRFDGESLFRLEKGAAIPDPSSRPIIAELLIQHRNLIQAVITPDWKYLAARKWVPALERPAVVKNQMDLVIFFQDNPSKRIDARGPVVREECYRLGNDPKERLNLIGSAAADKSDPVSAVSHDAPVGRLRSILDDYRRRCLPSPGLEKEQEVLSPEEVEKLKALGYL